MGELEALAAKLDTLAVDPNARLSYDLFAGGLIWTDEVPAWEDRISEEGIATVVGLGTFRGLLNHRTELILGREGNRSKLLWEQASQLCPNWPGFLPGRRDPALAEEARSRGEAAIRSWEELDERYREQQQARARATPA